MKRLLFTLIITFFGFSELWAQSPGLTGSIQNLSLSGYQQTSQKDEALGYPGLSSGSLLAPTEMFPSFTGEPDGTFWVKSGSSLAPISSSTIDSTGFTVQGIHIGLLSGSLYGVAQESAARPLILQGGTSSNSVYVYYGQTLGAANTGFTGFSWSIGPSGIFNLGAGTLSGALNMGGNNITSVDTVGNTALTIDFTASTLTGATGISLAATTGGVSVPNTTSSTNVAYALNRGSANTIYGQLATTNTWATTQTFTVQPVFTVPLAISQISSLQSDLNSLLSLAGGTMSGALIMGANQINGVADPTHAQDATTRTYVDNATTLSTGGTLTALVATAPLNKAMAGNVTTLSMPAATSSQNGYLSSTDWTTFNSKAGGYSASSPLTLVGGVLSMPVATGSAAGYLSSTDWTTFNGKEAAFTVTSPLVLSTGALSMPVATTSVSGYLSSSDWTTFNNKASSGANSSITSLTGLTTPLSYSEGGTGYSSYTNGQILIGSSVSSGLVHASPTAGAGISITPGAGSITFSNSASVALTMPAQFSVANSPLTPSGTLIVTWAAQSANTVLAGPTSGGPDVLAPRNLVAADLPVIPINKGGLGADYSSLAANNFFYTSGTGTISTSSVTALALTFLAATDAPTMRTALNFFTTTTSPSWGSISAGGATQDQTVSVSGAAVGDAVLLGLPATVDAGMVYQAWVSSSNNVTLRATNTKASGSVTPAALSFTVTVIH